MATFDPALYNALRTNWPSPPGEKARCYVGQFFAREHIGQRITAKVEGNYGTYNVAIWLEGNQVRSACGCYIGKHGFCHHCEALAHTYLQAPDSFAEISAKPIEELSSLNDVQAYLKATSLDTLLDQLKARGISQKAFAESIGMNPRHLTAVKSSERRGHYFNELGAIKLACLWALDHLGKG